MTKLPLAFIKFLLALNLTICILFILLGASLDSAAQNGDVEAKIAEPQAIQNQEHAKAPENLKQRIGSISRDEQSTPVAERLISILGLFTMIAIGFALSSNRRKIDWRLVAWGLTLQVIFAVLILKTSPGQWMFQKMSDVVNVMLGFTEDGARFVFGNLVRNNVPVGTPLGDPQMGPIIEPNRTAWAGTGAFFAFSVLPTIIFFSSLMTVLYHFGIMQFLVRAMAWIMRKTMKTSGAESLSAAGNIFVGMTEAPLMIRPYIDKMTNSEIMSVMTGGFATIAGGVMAAYVGMLRHIFPDIAGHLIAASVMSAPAALLMAKIMQPETEEALTRGTVKIQIEVPTVNVIDAAARGAADGLKLALNVGAMLLAFIALIAMINYGIGAIGGLFGLEDLSFQKIIGYAFWPLAWLMGISSDECLLAGQLLGEKTILNEFVAYLHLEQILSSGGQFSYRSAVIITYALAGFANLGSIAVQLGGIGGMAPNRRDDLARFGLKAMIAGTLACFMTATLAGILI